MDKKELTLDELKTMIDATVADKGKAAAEAAIAEFKKAGLQEEMKRIYPDFGTEGDFTGGQIKSRTGSVLDVSMLRKNNPHQTDTEYAA